MIDATNFIHRFDMAAQNSSTANTKKVMVPRGMAKGSTRHCFLGMMRRIETGITSSSSREISLLPCRELLKTCSMVLHASYRTLT